MSGLPARDFLVISSWPASSWRRSASSRHHSWSSTRAWPPPCGHGELLLVDRVTPRLVGITRGEVVIFRPPLPGYSGESFVKGVIGLPGEHVVIHDGHVYVDGRLLDEPYIYGGQATTTGLREFAMTAPQDAVFVMGDHRADSWDSRGYGPVPIATSWGGPGWPTIRRPRSRSSPRPPTPALGAGIR